MLSIDFLTKEIHFSKVDTSKNQLTFHFHDVDGHRQMRGLIGIPTNPEHVFWFRYFEKSRHDKLVLEELPPWFQLLVEQARDYVDKKYRLKRIFS